MTEENVPQETTPETEPPSGDAADAGPPPQPIAAPIQSRFLYVDVAAMRAKQLRRGALPRLQHVSPDAASARPDLPHKAERIAMEEVRQGLVGYDLPDGTPAPANAGTDDAVAEEGEAES